jgi:hypothetical protein
VSAEGLAISLRRMSFASGASGRGPLPLTAASL